LNTIDKLEKSANIRNSEHWKFNLWFISRSMLYYFKKGFSWDES